MSLCSSDSDYDSIYRSKTIYLSICALLFVFGLYKLLFIFMVMCISIIYPDEDNTDTELDEFLEFRSKFNQDYSVTESHELELIPEDLQDLLESGHFIKNKKVKPYKEVSFFYSKYNSLFDFKSKKKKIKYSSSKDNKLDSFYIKGLYRYSRYDYARFCDSIEKKL